MIKKIKLYLFFVLLFVVGKLAFMVYHGDVFDAYPAIQWFSVIIHGLPHDLTSAGYLMALPFLLEIPYIWITGSWHRRFMRFWIRLSVLLVVVNYFSDLFLYSYWGFRLDKTAVFYLFDNPVDCLGQAPWWMLLLAPVLIFAFWWVLQNLLCRLYPDRQNGRSISMDRLGVRWRNTLVTILLCGVLFILIRGGVTTSTMNVGRVYFSSEMPLNHAATNPFFSFFKSITEEQKDFARQYRFMAEDELDQAIAEMNTPRVCAPDSVATDSLSAADSLCVARLAGLSAAPSAADSLHWLDSLSAAGLVSLPDSLSAADSLRWADSLYTAFAATPANPFPDGKLLNVDRPNVVVLIFESFSGAICTGVNPDADPSIMPNVDRMYGKDGIGFTHMFANSFRTDRGVAAIMASYPGQPTNSVMKDQNKCNHLQYFSKAMKEEGYRLHFLHGGDVNFTNMKGFLTSGGFSEITGDIDFPVSQRMSKWGVPDHLMFNCLYDEMIGDTLSDSPYLKIMLTLSSHEPFDVPYRHFGNEYVNSIAYTDSCFGSFVRKLKRTAAWDNLLIIGVADHAYGQYPAGMQNHEIMRYRIPMFWTGGAIKAPATINTYCSQTDLGATLLTQLGIDCSDFNFSKDIMNPTIGHYGFYAFSDGFGFVTDSVRYIQDNAKDGQPLSGSHDPNGTAERWGKAYLQALYDDLAKR